MDTQNQTLIRRHEAGALATVATAGDTPGSVRASIERAASAAREYIRTKAPNTLRAYRADWADFTAWCERHGERALPATGETVALYLSDLASTAKVATLIRRMSAISEAHDVAGLVESPVRTAAVRTLMAGIRRAKGTAPQQKAAASIDTIRAMIGALDDSGRSASPPA